MAIALVAPLMKTLFLAKTLAIAIFLSLAPRDPRSSQVDPNAIPLECPK
jgi:hypothetical protein